MSECEHARISNQIRWDIAPNSIIAFCSDCLLEASIPVNWDEREWGDD